MKKKTGTCILFLCGLAALVISLKLLWNLGIYVDAHNTSPAAVFGGEFWNLMNWLRLFLLAGITLISGSRLFRKS